jgi:hypothetical protein
MLRKIRLKRRVTMQIFLWGALLLVGIGGAGVLFLRSYDGEDAVYVVEHRVRFPGTREAAWEILTRADLFSDWNPYVKKMEGVLLPGETLRVTIVQENWKLPVVVRPKVVTAKAPAELHWHGSILVSGFLETDHSFHFAEVGNGEIELVQREEFRGWLAHRMKDSGSQRYTFEAFERMDIALAERIREQETPARP